MHFWKMVQTLIMIEHETCSQLYHVVYIISDITLYNDTEFFSVGLNSISGHLTAGPTI